jgi:hypothetical protein
VNRYAGGEQSPRNGIPGSKAGKMEAESGALYKKILSMEQISCSWDVKRLVFQIYRLLVRSFPSFPM